MLPGLEGFHLDTYGRVENVDLLLMDAFMIQNSFLWSDLS